MDNELSVALQSFARNAWMAHPEHVFLTMTGVDGGRRQRQEGGRLADPRHRPTEIQMPSCSRYQPSGQVGRPPDSPQLCREQLRGNGIPGLSRATHKCLVAVRAADDRRRSGPYASGAVQHRRAISCTNCRKSRQAYHRGVIIGDGF